MKETSDLGPLHRTTRHEANTKRDPALGTGMLYFSGQIFFSHMHIYLEVYHNLCKCQLAQKTQLKFELMYIITQLKLHQKFLSLHIYVNYVYVLA